MARHRKRPRTRTATSSRVADMLARLLLWSVSYLVAGLLRHVWHEWLGGGWP